jgi:simple sugar transport system permease protein
VPLIFAAIGELVVERSGVLNLGVEGMMIVGALSGFVVEFHTGSSLLAVLAGTTSRYGNRLYFCIFDANITDKSCATGLALTLLVLELQLL